MPQTYSQKYSEELGSSPSNVEYNDMISWYVEKDLPLPRRPYSLQPSEDFETVEEGRYDEPKGKGKAGKPMGKKGLFTATSETPYSASAYSESTSETRYSASVYSESSGARERGVTVWESHGETWEDVTDDL